MPDHIEIPDPNSDGYIYLNTKYVVCSKCKGEGKHMNPSIGNVAYTRDDFDEDPDFARDYMSSLYDVTCYLCKGLRVVQEVDRENNSVADLAEYDRQEDERRRGNYEQYMEMRAEGQEVYYDDDLGVY